MADQFQDWGSQLDSPASNAAAVVPNNAADLAFSSRAIFVGVTGDLRVTMVGGQTVTFTAVAAGWHPIRVSRVYVTGTTATSIVAVW